MSRRGLLLSPWIVAGFLIGSPVVAREQPSREPAVAGCDEPRPASLRERDPRAWRARLESLAAKRQWRELEAEIRDALKERDRPDLRTMLAAALLDQGKPVDAEEQARVALKMDPASEPSRYLLAMALSRQGLVKMDASIQELKQLIEAAPSYHPGRLLAADLYVRTGRRSLAIQMLNDGLALTPENRELRLGLIRLHSEQFPPDYDAAAKLIQAAEDDPLMQADPLWAREAAKLAALRGGPNDGPLVIKKMRRARELSPENLDIRREYIELLLHINDVASAMLESERLDREGVGRWWVFYLRGVAISRQVSRERLRRSANDPADAAKIKAIHAEALEQFDRALKVLDETTDGGPATMAAAARDTETVLRDIGSTINFDEALARLQPRTANDPDQRWTFIQIAMKSSKGDFDGATAIAERVLADPSNPASKMPRRTYFVTAAADAYARKGDYAKARQAYVDLLKLDDKNGLALNNLAWLLADTMNPPQPQEARKYSEQAYQLAMQSEVSTATLDTHGWTLVLCGGRDVEAGLAILKNLVEQHPRHTDARYHLGEAYLRLAKPEPDRAAAELRACIQLIADEEKLGNPVDESLRKKAQAALEKLQSR